LLVVLTEAHADNPELARLAAQDQSDRAEKNGRWNDDARRWRVLELLAAGAVATPRTLANPVGCLIKLNNNLI